MGPRHKSPHAGSLSPENFSVCSNKNIRKVTVYSEKAMGQSVITNILVNRKAVSAVADMTAQVTVLSETIAFIIKYDVKADTNAFDIKSTCLNISRTHEVWNDWKEEQALVVAELLLSCDITAVFDLLRDTAVTKSYRKTCSARFGFFRDTRKINFVHIIY